MLGPDGVEFGFCLGLIRQSLVTPCNKLGPDSGTVIPDEVRIYRFFARFKCGLEMLRKLGGAFRPETFGLFQS
jgi:hypothetical protein